MSYCRFGVDSSVYVYRDVDGGITCAGCRLSPERRFNTDTAKSMIAHLKEHRTAGDRVPGYAIAELREDIIR